MASFGSDRLVLEQCESTDRFVQCVQRLSTGHLDLLQRSVPFEAARCSKYVQLLAFFLCFPFVTFPFPHLVFDASAKIRPGFLSGDFVDFGHYGQCMSVSGHHCIVRARWPIPSDFDEVMKINLTATDLGGNSFLEYHAEMYKLWYHEHQSLGICLPSSCSSLEITGVLRSYAKLSRLPIEFEANCESNEWREEEKFEQHPVKKLAAFVLVSIVTIVLVSTLLLRTVPSTMPKCAIYFDLVENGRKILIQGTDEDNKRLQFLNGIRFLYTLLTVSGHLYTAVGTNMPLTHSKSNDSGRLYTY